MDEPTTLRVERDDRGVATVTLDRPAVRNAFDATLIDELGGVVERLATDDAVRVVVLTGAGDVFSAGADLNWMGSMVGWTFEQNVADSTEVDRMLRSLYDLPKPLVGRINGHALGGGTGLVAVCDVAVAVEGARLGFTEVVLGLAPAVISPYVVRKIGRSAARALFVTGEQFPAARAERLGLVHEVVPADQLDAAVEAVVARCLRGGPHAQAAAKVLAEQALRPLDEAAADTVRTIARLRVDEEGQAGMRAFLERRPAPWVDGGAG